MGDGPYGSTRKAFRPPPFTSREEQVVAGLGVGVVSSKGKRSGGLITARAALDANRAVFACRAVAESSGAGPNEPYAHHKLLLSRRLRHMRRPEPGLVLGWAPGPRTPASARGARDLETRVIGSSTIAPAPPI